MAADDRFGPLHTAAGLGRGAQEKRESLVRRARQRTGLTQAQFASVYGLRLGYIQDQEQNRSNPPALGRLAFKFIEMFPEAAELAAVALQAEKSGEGRSTRDCGVRDRLDPDLIRRAGQLVRQERAEREKIDG